VRLEDTSGVARCGTGEHALLAAVRDTEAAGVGEAATAIEYPPAKAAERESSLWVWAM
jgi:hypothetical protein